ncbi:MAG: leucyl/phenylalanyl-tRNA--protein transferase [Pseudomonadota bacterium]
MSEPIKPLEITPTLLLRAYAAGVFPMAQSAESDEIFWVDPKRRGVLPLPAFHVPRSLRKRVRRDDYRATIDTAFEAVLDGCAGRSETWINPEIRDLYGTLHRLGYASSVEVWQEERLIGGLYGVRLGGAFFGESMFSVERDASKIALVWLVARLKAGGFQLLDTQFVTEHLRHFGAVEVPRSQYHRELEAALALSADFYSLPETASGADAVQLSTQTS